MKAESAQRGLAHDVGWSVTILMEAEMKGNIIQRIWVAAFLAMIFGVHFIWLAAGGLFTTESHENRSVAEAPAFSLDTIEEFPEQWEAYYNDRLPFRSQLIGINSELEYMVFGASSNQGVITGQDGWLFYNNLTDDNSIEAYKGMNLFTEEELRQIADKLAVEEEALAEKGTEFILFIAPNKERVYAEKLPEYYGAPADMYRTRQLIDYLCANTDIRVVYPYEELMEAKAADPRRLYYRLDTHWNELGAYTGVKALLRELDISMPPLEELTVTETEPTICDLADMINLRERLNTDPDYRLSGYDEYHLTTELHDITGAYIYHCEGADPRRLFMVRDSFADAMDDLLASRFDDSYMIHYGSYSPALAEQEQPDIYVYETVERRIGALLEFTF